MSYGKDIEVLEPKKLRDEVRTEWLRQRKPDPGRGAVKPLVFAGMIVLFSLHPDLVPAAVDSPPWAWEEQ